MYPKSHHSCSVSASRARAAPLKKGQIMMFAEESGVNKDPMFGNGKNWYNGWAGVKVSYFISGPTSQKGYQLISTLFAL